MDEVQFSSELKLPSLIRKQVLADTERLLAKHREWFGNAQAELHLRREGPQVECFLNVITDDGRYHARVLGWDVRQILHEAIERCDIQMHKRMDSRQPKSYDRTVET